MNNPITYAVRFIKQRINVRILRDTFTRDQSFRMRSVKTIESEITRLIIEDIVMPDCSHLGGRETWIDMRGMSPLSRDADGLVYKIPKDRTQGRSIISSHFVSFGNLVSGIGGTASGSANFFGMGTSVTSNMTSVLNTSTGEYVNGTTDVSDIGSGENIVFIKSWGGSQSPKDLLCVLENDQLLNQLSPKSYEFFAELCLHACKMYIYNTLSIELDMGKLEAGSELGTYSRIIESYADAAENYSTYLRETMEVVFMLNDPRKKEEYNFMITGGRR